MPAQTSAVSKTSGIEDLRVQRKKKLEGEEMLSRKRQELLEAEDARQRRDRERLLRMQEQQQLKEKLAQEGMGDVTVVLPDAPPMEATDLSTSAPAMATSSTSASSLPATTLALIRESVQPPPPPAGVGFMARKNGGPPTKADNLNSSIPSTVSRIDNVLKKEYGSGGSPALVSKTMLIQVSKFELNIQIC